MNKYEAEPTPQKLTGQTGNDATKKIQIMVPLKRLSNFRRTVDINRFKQTTSTTCDVKAIQKINQIKSRSSRTNDNGFH